MKQNQKTEKNPRILVIEDDPSYMKVLKDQLAKKKYVVLEAKDGNEGLIQSKIHKPDLILLDIKMPGMNGIAMLDELRKDPYGKCAKVIILTNIEPDSKILDRVLVDQPTYYLIKSDIQIVELLAQVKQVLSYY